MDAGLDERLRQRFGLDSQQVLTGPVRAVAPLPLPRVRRPGPAFIMRLDHLRALEAESIFILREVVAEFGGRGIALSDRGETMVEIAAAAQAMRDRIAAGAVFASLREARKTRPSCVTMNMRSLPSSGNASCTMRW